MVRYITGIYALNLQSNTDTTGDWHYHALDWNKPRILESEDTPYDDSLWRIHQQETPENGEQWVADHIRACCDLLLLGHFGPGEEIHVFIDNERYNKELFDHVLMLKHEDNWPKINQVMHKQFGKQWDTYTVKAHAYA